VEALRYSPLFKTVLLTQFIIELHDSTGTDVTTLPVTLFNPASGYSQELVLNVDQSGTFVSSPLSIFTGSDADMPNSRLGNRLVLKTRLGGEATRPGSPAQRTSKTSLKGASGTLVTSIRHK